MKKLKQYLKIVVIIVLAIVSAGCNTVNNTANINSSYYAIKKAYADNPSNSEIAFIYNAINNKTTEYPKTVPDFVDLPIDSIIDAIATSERINIEYTNDDDYENGIITAQEPAAGAAWSDGVIVNLTVNKKYNSLNSKRGYMCETLDKLYLLTLDRDNNYTGTIWADGEKLADGDITRIYADNGNVYYNNGSGVNRLNAEGVSQVFGKKTIQQVVINEKLYYRDIEKDSNFYCYNMNDKTNSFVHDEKVLFPYANSDYIVFHCPHDIFILDSGNFTIIKHIQSEKFFAECFLDNDNVFYAETTFDSFPIQNFIITKYNIKQDEQVEVFKTDALIHDILAVDDKIIFTHLADNHFGFRYIDMRNMEEKYFTTDDDILDWDDDITDILFDGQRIIYEKEDGTVYSICIFTGETKKICEIGSGS